MMKNENVLYILRSAMETTFDFSKEIWPVGEEALTDLPYAFAARTLAETDPSKKQLIPYALLLNDQGKVLTYCRKGSEKRLADIRSVGWGGHVNDKDGGSTLLEILHNGLARELSEEVGLNTACLERRMLGMINEERSDVGHSHTGVVFSFKIGHEKLKFNSEIASPEWKSPADLKLSDFELWSSLALELFL